MDDSIIHFSPLWQGVAGDSYIISSYLLACFPPTFNS